MASHSADRPENILQTILQRSIARTAGLIWAAMIAGGVGFLALALATYDPRDRALHTAAADTSNWLGGAGALAAEHMLLIGGVGAALLLPLGAMLAWRLWYAKPQPHWKRQILLMVVGIILIGTAMQLSAPGSRLDLPAGWGGVIALLLAPALRNLFALADPIMLAPLRWSTVVILVGLGTMSAWRSFGLPKYLMLQAIGALRARAQARAQTARLASANNSDSRTDPMAIPLSAPPRSKPRARPIPEAHNHPPPTISDPTSQTTLLQPAIPRQNDLFQNYVLPPVALLLAPTSDWQKSVDKTALERNARLLESVLEDFQVKGAIIAVRPGPVVTMYELNPTPGTKANRVISLADDIARNMSALSARIAPIPGRTVIGIELPNAKRKNVLLHEIIASNLFQKHSGLIPIILGKDISGAPVVVDLAPMPHLLIAGTTGSGKSVGLNGIILSLLYRMVPEQCRLIMIDPKMLELSVYDGIPHLLAPVVTDPKKAIRALKWAVEQMEERYRIMSSLSVRNLTSYNDKVRVALAEGRTLSRRVQTGYDPTNGQPLYEEEHLDCAPLPQIVIVVDELADLMMTAGKEVEFLIQRLAQKARAAGIHLILATQRPSVDIITGVIKANMPTRISFNVTSKIDSRTILGTMGAEQLLGKGDMLYSPGGQKLTRIHGPFVSDDEVRAIADHWRAQGRPSYIESVTETPEEDSGFALEGASLQEDSAEERLYARACQLVMENQKASTSWLQRQLRIGYNSAARLIERMEKESLVTPPNHVGRRDVLTKDHLEG